MARDQSEKSAHTRKKQKVNSGASSSQRTTTLGTLPSMTRRKQILRRVSGSSDPPPEDGRRQKAPMLPPIMRRKPILRQISSGSPEPPPEDSRRQKAPTYYQPQSPHPGGENSEGDEDDDDEDDEPVLGRLQKLPKHGQYTMIGKIFALKIWPWPSSNWWIGDEGAGVATEEPTGTLALVKDKAVAHAKKMLDPVKKNQFAAFLSIDMGIMADEWMTPTFRSKVIVPSLAQ